MPTENWRRRNISPFLSKTLSFFCRLLYQSCVRNCIYVHVYCVLCIVNSVCVHPPTHPLPSALELAIVRAHNIYHQNSMQLIIMCCVFWAVCTLHWSPTVCTKRWSRAHHGHTMGTPWAHLVPPRRKQLAHLEEMQSKGQNWCIREKRLVFNFKVFIRWKNISRRGYYLKLWWLNCKRYFVILCRQVFIMST